MGSSQTAENSDNTVTLAKNIKVLMDSSNTKEGDLAKALNLPYNTIRRLINGETVDPRASTLRLIANYFNTTIDALTNNSIHNKHTEGQYTVSIPVFSWRDIYSSSTPLLKRDFTQCNYWQTIVLDKKEEISEYTFGLESSKSMQPRFPLGSLFIINPDIRAIDGDFVLVKFDSTGELTLRELAIDPPYWKLVSVISDSSNVEFESKEHEIIGVIVLTIVKQRT